MTQRMGSDVNKILFIRKNGDEVRIFPLRCVRVMTEESPGVSLHLVRARLRCMLADSEIPGSRKQSKEIVNRAIEYGLVRLTADGRLYPVQKEES